MNDIMYRKILVTANKSPDGESPTVLYATKEINGYGVFIESFDKGLECIKWFRQSQRDEAIEYAIDYGRAFKK